MDLKKRIEVHGFSARVISHFGGARGGIVEKLDHILGWAPLTPLSIHFARPFVLVAERV